MLESYSNTIQALIKNAVLNQCLQVKGAMLGCKDSVSKSEQIK